MAQDYYIWIKGKGTGANSFDNTKPFDSRASSDGDETTSNFVPQFMNGFNQTQNFLSSGFQNAINTGVSALAKVFPWVAIAVAITKVSDKVISAVGSGFATYNGDYKFDMEYNNVKATISNVINPIGFAVNQRKLHEQWNLQNKRVEQQRILTGKNTMLAITNKGV